MTPWRAWASLGPDHHLDPQGAGRIEEVSGPVGRRRDEEEYAGPPTYDGAMADESRRPAKQPSGPC